MNVDPEVRTPSLMEASTILSLISGSRILESILIDLRITSEQCVESGYDDLPYLRFH